MSHDDASEPSRAAPPGSSSAASDQLRLAAGLGDQGSKARAARPWRSMVRPARSMAGLRPETRSASGCPGAADHGPTGRAVPGVGPEVCGSRSARTSMIGSFRSSRQSRPRRMRRRPLQRRQKSARRCCAITRATRGVPPDRARGQVSVPASDADGGNNRHAIGVWVVSARRQVPPMHVCARCGGTWCWRMHRSSVTSGALGCSAEDVRV